MREDELSNGRKIMVHEDEVVCGPYGITNRLREMVKDHWEEWIPYWGA